MFVMIASFVSFDSSYITCQYWVRHPLALNTVSTRLGIESYSSVTFLGLFSCIFIMSTSLLLDLSPTTFKVKLKLLLLYRPDSFPNPLDNG